MCKCGYFMLWKYNAGLESICEDGFKEKKVCDIKMENYLEMIDKKIYISENVWYIIETLLKHYWDFDFCFKLYFGNCSHLKLEQEKIAITINIFCKNFECDNNYAKNERMKEKKTPNKNMLHFLLQKQAFEFGLTNYTRYPLFLNILYIKMCKNSNQHLTLVSTPWTVSLVKFMRIVLAQLHWKFSLNTMWLFTVDLCASLSKFILHQRHFRFQIQL